MDALTIISYVLELWNITLFQAHFLDWPKTQQEVKNDKHLNKVVEDLITYPPSHSHYFIISGMLLHKSRVVLSITSTFIHVILS